MIDAHDGCGHGIPTTSICKPLGQYTGCAVLHLDPALPPTSLWSPAFAGRSADALEQLACGPRESQHIGDHAKGPGGPPPPRHSNIPSSWKAQEAEHGAGHREYNEADAERAREDPGPDGGDSEEDGERHRHLVEGRVGD